MSLGWRHYRVRGIHGHGDGGAGSRLLLRATSGRARLSSGQCGVCHPCSPEYAIWSMRMPRRAQRLLHASAYDNITASQQRRSTLPIHALSHKSLQLHLHRKNGNFTPLASS
jgi:hypothetical protein